MRWLLLNAFLLFVASAASDDCKLAQDLAASGIKSNFVQCKAEPCNPDSVDVTDAAECAATAHCFVVGEKCSSKILLPSNLKKDDDFSSLVSAEKSNIDQRFFNTGGNTGMGGPNFLPSCQPYPIGCNIHINNPASILEALEPPVDIPYCLRIPCDQMMPSLELDRRACVRRPGCYYDTELANMRQLVGQQVLAGVPVCQMAIRNHNFQKDIVSEKMSDGSSFNGLYSKCYLKRNPLTPNPGCVMISSLEYFGFKPKRAGWEGITEQECLFIDGCPTAQGCMLPSATSSIRVRSATVDTTRPLTAKEKYGQPMCQPFEMDMSNPDSFVADYNQCMQSGCVVDDSVGANEVMTALYQIIQKAPGLNQMQKLQVLQKVIQGDVGPHNIQEAIKNMGNSGNCNLQQLLAGLMGNNGGNLGGGMPDLSGLSNLLGGLPNLGGSMQDLGSLLGGGSQTGGSQTGFVAPFSLELGDDDDEDEDGSEGRFFLGGDQTSGVPTFPNSGGNTGSGPDIGSLLSMGTGLPTGAQAGNPFAGLTGGNPFGGNTGNPFGGNTGNPFGGNTGNPFGGNTGNPFGGNTGNPFGGNTGNPFGGNTGNPFGGNPFAQGQGGINNILAGLGMTGSGLPGGMNFGGCPYAPFSLAGLPALKGRFTGCCDRNLCFYPRTTILQQHSGIASYYGQWGSWSECSVTCGGGRQERKRKCVTINDEPCEAIEGASSTEEKICNDQQCPVMTNWGAWSACSVTCGVGVRERFRQCLPVGASCTGAVREDQECAASTPCPVFGEWSSFSACSSDCGEGTKTRTRPCVANCDTTTPNDLEEEISCYTVNGKVTWESTACEAFPKCWTEVTKACIKTDGTPGCCGADFHSVTELQRCTKGTCMFCEMVQYQKFCKPERLNIQKVWTGA